MSEKPSPRGQHCAGKASEDTGAGADRSLRDFRYVVASVNDSALATWAELWQELQGSVTADGAVAPQAEQGFTPGCGWAKFLEKLWVLKHYLDYIHRFSKE
jgi:hypothetical protein